jgi:hypothetical protein
MVVQSNILPRYIILLSALYTNGQPPANCLILPFIVSDSPNPTQFEVFILSHLRSHQLAYFCLEPYDHSYTPLPD